MELAYWPTFQLLLWGFITTFFLTHSPWVAQAAGVLISAVLLWDVLFRSNLGLSLMFLEEMWSRNLGQLFISPLRPLEMVGALMVMSFLRTIISVTPAALVLRLGLGAESLAWLGIFLVAPISGIYYPIEVLPDWLEPVAWSLPSSYVFEGMRAVLFDNVFRWDLFAGGVGLNALYLILCTGVFLHLFGIARKRGLLLQQGE